MLTKVLARAGISRTEIPGRVTSRESVDFARRLSTAVWGAQGLLTKVDPIGWTGIGVT